MESERDTATPATELSDRTGSSRRELFAALLGGGAVASAATLLAAARVSAAESDSPQRDESDNADLNDALVGERNVVGIYASLAASSALSDEERAVVLAFHAHHQAYVDAIKAYLGPKATSAALPVPADSTASFAQSASGLAAVERNIATAHTDKVGRVKGTEAAALLASIVIIEVRHAVALDSLASSL